MKSNSKWNWLVALTAVAILSFFSTGNALAWGPLAQSAIAQAVQDASGMPPATANRNFVLETTNPKVYEYTHHAYANLSYDYTDIMLDSLHGMNDYCQALAWGVAQTAEKTGDSLFFHQNSRDTYERWVNELLCDSLLSCVESPYQGTALAEVAVVPKLVSDTSIEYTSIFGGDSFSGVDAVLSANFQAFVLVGELAVTDSPIFQQNAKDLIDVADWTIAMDKSVENAVEFAVNSTQAQSSGNWMVGQASDYGAQLLGKLGTVLVATGDASIAAQHYQGVYSYRSCLTTDRVNQITVAFLYDVSRNLDEHPIVRHMARTLYSLMTEDVIDFNFGGGIPQFGPDNKAE